MPNKGDEPADTLVSCTLEGGRIVDWLIKLETEDDLIHILDQFEAIREFRDIAMLSPSRKRRRNE